MTCGACRVFRNTLNEKHKHMWRKAPAAAVKGSISPMLRKVELSVFSKNTFFRCGFLGSYIVSYGSEIIEIRVLMA